MKYLLAMALMISAAAWSAPAGAADAHSAPAPRLYTRMADQRVAEQSTCDIKLAACDKSLAVCIRNAGGSLLLQRRCDKESQTCESDACSGGG